MGGATLLSYTTSPMISLISDSMSVIMSAYGWSHTPILYDITYFSSHFRLHVRNHVCLWLDPHCYSIRHHLCFLSFQTPCPRSCLLIDGDTLLSFMTIPVYFLISDSMSAIMSAYGWSHTAILYDITHVFSHFRLHVRNHISLWLEPHCYPLRHHLCFLSFQTPCSQSCLLIDRATLLSFLTIPMFFLISDSISAIMVGVTHVFFHFRLNVRNHVSLWMEPYCYPVRHHIRFLRFGWFQSGGRLSGHSNHGETLRHSVCARKSERLC